MPPMHLLLLCVLLTSSTFFYISLAIQCVDENNNNVDWYVMYKIPHIKKNCTNKLIKKGEGYLFITSANLTQQWHLSEFSVNYTESFLSRTLKPLYDAKQTPNLVHLMYNDQPPNKSPKKNKGHTKGVVVGDENGGIWLVHSVPLYPPPVPSQYAYPNTGAVYGQSALCMTLDAENLNKVGIQLKYNQPQVYSSNMPADLVTKYQDLNDVINFIVVTQAPWNQTLAIKTKGGADFLSFAKSKEFGMELYEDWVAPTLKVNLLTETWLNNEGNLTSNCSQKYSVKNIRGIKLDSASVAFKSGLDHSKWTVSNSTEENWICIGDINREEHQKARGGGTVCMNNKVLADAYRSTISVIEDCPKPKKSYSVKTNEIH